MEKIFEPVRGLFLMICVIGCITSIRTCTPGPDRPNDLQDSSLQRNLKSYIDKVFSIDDYFIMPGVSIEKVSNTSEKIDKTADDSCGTQRNSRSIQDYLEEKLDQYTKTHVLSVKMPQTARLFFARKFSIVNVDIYRAERSFRTWPGWVIESDTNSSTILLELMLIRRCEQLSAAIKYLMSIIRPSYSFVLVGCWMKVECWWLISCWIFHLLFTQYIEIFVGISLKSITNFNGLIECL